MCNSRQLSLNQCNILETLLHEGTQLFDIAQILNRDPRGIKYENIQHQTAFAIAEVFEIDRNLLFDEFAQFMDYPYNNKLRKLGKYTD